MAGSTSVLPLKPRSPHPSRVHQPCFMTSSILSIQQKQLFKNLSRDNDITVIGTGIFIYEF